MVCNVASGAVPGSGDGEIIMSVIMYLEIIKMEHRHHGNCRLVEMVDSLHSSDEVQFEF